MGLQTWDSKQYGEKVSFVSALGEPVLELLGARADECILDLGCGDGALTEKIAAGEVIGIDASEDMVRAACARGLNAVVMSGDQLDYQNRFDAVFSNAALHWIQDYRAVLRGVARALKPEGRFVAEFGGCGNVAGIIAAVEKVCKENSASFHNPWFFPSDVEYKSYLEESGFAVPYIELIPRPTTCDITEWLRVFALQAVSGIPEREFIEKTIRALGANSGVWQADYVRLRFYAVKL